MIERNSISLSFTFSLIGLIIFIIIFVFPVPTIVLWTALCVFASNEFSSNY